MNDRYAVWVVCMYNDGDAEPRITAFSNKEAADPFVMDNIAKYDHVFYQVCPLYGKYKVGDNL